VKREIHKRESDGLTVTLIADLEDSDCKEISCHVVDVRQNVEFTISDVPPHKALDVFYHPFAFGEGLLKTGTLVHADDAA
jgi:hypothetical protein